MNQTLENETKQFWNQRVLDVGNVKQIQSVGLPPMRLRICSNELDSSCKFASRPVIASWSDNEGIVAYAEAVMVGPRRSGQAVDPTSFIVEMDYISQASYDFAEVLVETHVDHNPFGSAGSPRDAIRWVVDFRILEVHPSRRGHKIGVRLGTQFLEALRMRFEVGMFVLKPYPLQYSSGDGPREVRSSEENPVQFEEDTQKLRTLYCDSWFASALPGTDRYLFVPGSTPHRLVTHNGEKHWSFERI
nr:hypothetical protein [Rhodoferax sp.]